MRDQSDMGSQIVVAVVVGAGVVVASRNQGNRGRRGAHGGMGRGMAYWLSCQN